MITVLTPTGARPEAFAACIEQMRAQEYDGPVLWVVVDDGPDPFYVPKMPTNWHVECIRPSPLWKPGQNTLARNIREGLPRCNEKVVIVEDDDAYAPWWLGACDERLNEADLIGESHSLYRHVVTRRETAMANDKHASLCSTAIKGSALDALRRSCEQGPKGIDMRLWKDFDGTKKLYRPEPRGVTGIKGWPGRPGIGVGHRL